MKTRAFAPYHVVIMSATALMIALTLTGCSATTSGGGTPPPTVSVSATPASITSGQSSVIAITSSNATSCTGTDALVGITVPLNGAIATVSPTATSTYGVTCSGAGGSTAASAIVTVTTAATVNVTVNRAAVLGENGAKTDMSGNVRVTNSGGPDTAFICASASPLVTMNDSTACTYTLEAVGSGDATITVTAHADTTKTASFTVHVGNWVIFQTQVATYIVDLNKGTTATQLLPGSAECSDPSISYDASMFVCQQTSLTSNDSVLQIYQTDGTASGTKLLTSFDLTTQDGVMAAALVPSFSPDGTKIIFVVPIGSGVQVIYAINTDWSGLKPLFTEAASQVGLSPVHFTPDGKQIMFENVSTITVWIMNADGSNPQPFISAPSSNTAMYSVDANEGMSTLYYSDGTPTTYVEDAATGKVTATISGYALLGVLPNDGGIILRDNGGNLYTAPADGVGIPTLLATGSGWGSAY